MSDRQRAGVVVGCSIGAMVGGAALAVLGSVLPGIALVCMAASSAMGWDIVRRRVV